MNIRATVLRCHPLLIAFLASIALQEASAQSMPDEVRQKLMEMGPTYTSPAVNELFRPLLAVAPKDNIKIIKNVSYGQHPRQVLDVFQPVGKTNAPVFVFVHGGGYVGGSKDANVHPDGQRFAVAPAEPASIATTQRNVVVARLVPR